jgi:hypothetical protein
LPNGHIADATVPPAPAAEPPRRDIPSIRREQPAAPGAAGTTAQPGSALRAIRDRLQQR